jgi:hypothetical protein
MMCVLTRNNTKRAEFFARTGYESRWTLQATQDSRHSAQAAVESSGGAPEHPGHRRQPIHSLLRHGDWAPSRRTRTGTPEATARSSGHSGKLSTFGAGASSVSRLRSRGYARPAPRAGHHPSPPALPPGVARGGSLLPGTASRCARRPQGTAPERFQARATVRDARRQTSIEHSQPADQTHYKLLTHTFRGRNFHRASAFPYRSPVLLP